MLRWFVTGCCLLAVQTSLVQANDGTVATPLCPAPIGAEPQWNAPVRYPATFLRDTALGARPHFGRTCDPTHGYDHYEHGSKRYGLWYRPAAFAEDTNPHCVSRRFRPRGYGWANRLDCMQMDYHPYVVKQPQTGQGPSYYNRPPLEPCHCALQGCGRHKQGALIR